MGVGDGPRGGSGRGEFLREERMTEATGIGAQAPADRAGTRVPLLWSAGVAVAALATYLWLTPHVGSETDGSELTLVLAVGGVPHPTGYPMYILIGRLFCSLLHATGASWWYAANAWSAVGAAVAVFFLHALAARLVPASSSLGRGARFAIALLPAGLLALNPIWLNEATLAEVNSWHVAWVVGACLLCFALTRRLLETGAGRPPGKGAAVGWGLTCGLGLAHHLTSVIFVGPLTLALGWALARSKRWSFALVVTAIAGALAPLASYAYVAYRAFSPAPFQWPLLDPSVESVWSHIRGARFGFFLGHFAPAEAQRALLDAWMYPFLIGGFVVLLLSAWRASIAGRTFLGGAIGAAALQGLFVLNYGVVDPAPYFLPLLVVGLLGVPLAAAFIAERVRYAYMLGVLALAGLIFLAVPSVRGARTRMTRLNYVESRVRAAWEAIPFREAIVLWQDDMYVRLRAYQLLDGEKPGLYVENPNMLTWSGPRHAFEKRFGFDPLAQLALRTDADLAFVPMNIKRLTEVPVVDFMEVLWMTGGSTNPPRQTMQSPHGGN